MKTASYISTQTETGGVGKYPLSTQTLDFIQSQILLLQQLSLIGGKRYILQEPDGMAVGYVVIDGEVLPMAAKPIMGNTIKYITVKTEKEDIEADGEVYVEARTVRTAAYSPVKSGAENYEVNTFTNFAPNTTLAAQIKSMPETVLKYLQDVMAEKLSSLTVSGMTRDKLDGIKIPCIISCVASVSLFGGYTNYSVFVRLMGKTVYQELTLPDNAKYFRTFTTTWSEWSKVTENLHIEVKISKGTVYLRHGQLPADADIMLLRKKKRSKFRRTGGAKSYSHNKGKRDLRQPKSQYVHYKGIILSKGEAGKWYVPKCISVANKAVDSVLIDKEIAGICRELIRETTTEDGTTFRIFGLRNRITSKNGKGRQHHGYVPIAVQAACSKGSYSKDSGGEMVKMKYRISRRKYKVNGQFAYAWYRSFSLE